jgi:hypothetical protein
MADVERDSTEDWLVPEEARPATMLELGQRVDVALAVARSAEAAAVEIGAAAFDAAEQARRAAEFAERAVTGEEPRELPPLGDELPLGDDPGRAGSESGGGTPPLANGVEPRLPRNGDTATVVAADDRLKLFSERADRVMDRLRALEPVAS